MIIKILGTSASKPFPRKNGVDPISLSKNTKDKRSRSAIISTDECNIVIDFGPDISGQLEREKIKRIDAIIITHHHSDHIEGFKKLNLRDFNNKVIPVYASKEALEKIKNKYRNAFFEPKAIHPQIKFNFNGNIILPIEVIHPGITPVFAIQIEEGNKRIIYMPDFLEVQKKVEKYFYNVEVLILGGAVLEHDLPWHKSIKNSIGMAKKFRAKKVYFTHLGVKTLPHEELVSYVKKHGGKNFDILFDGEEINF